MSVLRHRRSPDVTTLHAVAAGLAAAVVVLLGTVTGASADQLLLTAATVGLLAVALAATAVRAVRPVPVPIHPCGVGGAVPASTAYWCALDAPRCPQRPRAPGRH